MSPTREYKVRKGADPELMRTEPECVVKLGHLTLPFLTETSVLRYAVASEKNGL